MDKRYLEEDPVRWFDALGKCSGCHKPANGKLMGPRNESYGTYCTACANKRLKKAEASRATSPASVEAVAKFADAVRGEGQS